MFSGRVSLAILIVIVAAVGFVILYTKAWLEETKEEKKRKEEERTRHFH